MTGSSDSLQPPPLTAAPASPARGGDAASDLARAVADPARLARVRRTGLLDTPPDASFDRLTRVAARVLRAPVAMVTLVDGDRDFVKSCVGLPEPLATAREIAMAPTFCQYAVATREPLVVGDALDDPRVAAFPAVTDLGARACVVVPLVMTDGFALGSFCVVDFAPRQWTDDEVATLVDLTGSVLAEIELYAASAALGASELRFRATFEQAGVGMCRTAPDGRWLEVNDRFCEITGYSRDELVHRSVAAFTHPDDRARDRDAMHRLAAGELSQYQVEKRYTRKDGTFVWVHLTSTFVVPAVGASPDSSGYFVSVIEDVSERRAAEAALQEVSAALQDQNRQLEEQALELELSNQQLQDQAAELEAQAEALHVAAAALRERTDAAEHARREAELARQGAEAAEDQLRTVFAQAPAAVVVTSGPEHRFVLLNARAESIAGRTHLVGQTYGEAFPELAAQGLVDLLDRVYASGEPFVAHETPVRIDRDGGSTHEAWYDFVYQPLRDAGGQVTGILQHAVDVTERVQARDALAESERQFRMLADAIPTLAWTARADGYLDWYNARWYAYTGTTPEQMAGWGWQSVHDPAALPAVLAEWQASIATGAPFEMTFPLRGADGRFRRFLTRVTPVRNADGQVTRWFGTNADVETERAARDAALDAVTRTERLQALTASLAAAGTMEEVAGVVVAQAATLAHATTAALVVRPADSDEVVIVRQTGMPADVLGRYARFPITMPGPAAHAIRTGEAVFVETRDGLDGLDARFPELRDTWERLGTCAIATVPLAAGGTVIGAMSFTFIVPRLFPPADQAFFLAVAHQAAQALERARLLDAEREARAAAEAANKVKTEFLSTMSHELRTPLNAIGGYAQLLEMGVRGPVTAAQTTDLTRIRQAGQHLQSLINDILNFARLDAGHVHFDLQDVPVLDALAEVDALMAPQLRERGLEYRSEGCVPDASTRPLVARADPEKLRQILLNLLTNAIKFTPSGGRIALGCAVAAVGPENAPGVRLSVSDTGRGIPADQLHRIFEPFVQVDRRLTGDSQQGVGLGLAISRDLARGMGGDLVVESEVGVGSVFTLILPSE